MVVPKEQQIAIDQECDKFFNESGKNPDLQKIKNITQLVRSSASPTFGTPSALKKSTERRMHINVYGSNKTVLGKPRNKSRAFHQMLPHADMSHSTTAAAAYKGMHAALTNVVDSCTPLCGDQVGTLGRTRVTKKMKEEAKIAHLQLSVGAPENPFTPRAIPIVAFSPADSRFPTTLYVTMRDNNLEDDPSPVKEVIYYVFDPRFHSLLLDTPSSLISCCIIHSCRSFQIKCTL